MPQIPLVCNLKRRPLCHILSKAIERSQKTMHNDLHSSMILTIYDMSQWNDLLSMAKWFINYNLIYNYSCIMWKCDSVTNIFLSFYNSQQIKMEMMQQYLN